MNAANEERFRDLYERTSRNVYAYLRRHADPDVAESVLAETYVKAWRHLGELSGEPIGWLIATARNTLLDHHRSARRHDQLTDALFSAARDTQWETPESAALTRHMLLDALRQLSEADREALLLVGWDGLDHAAAARVMNCSANAFTKRLERARRRLTQLVAPSVEAPFLRPVPKEV
ncbi:RNA polymerase sigma factor [Tessaracoccus sp. OS52]|uniref:RNA polymerase sigma factor n=1 Tax=Tessaracoccus sp. OS52 TaxID=2886691 RepID=UPI001D0FFF0C|nr:RNA polymerase sigma factor [Tessaracoccus sp. OS52]